MHQPRIVTASAATVFALGLASVITAGAATPAAEPLPAVTSPLITVQTGGYVGKWSIQGSSLVESFEQDGVVISNGTTHLDQGVGADQVTSLGFVAGTEDFAQLSGQAGSDVTAIRITSASGVVTPATLTEGVWAAVWKAGDSAYEFGAATIEFDSTSGTNTVSTDDIDTIAAEQKRTQ